LTEIENVVKKQSNSCIHQLKKFQRKKKEACTKSNIYIYNVMEKERKTKIISQPKAPTKGQNEAASGFATYKYFSFLAGMYQTVGHARICPLLFSLLQPTSLI
jgi:hypothetical protein